MVKVSAACGKDLLSSRLSRKPRIVMRKKADKFKLLQLSTTQINSSLLSSLRVGS